mgnify:CR=1 FL=1|jgi:hypothetical protein
MNSQPCASSSATGSANFQPVLENTSIAEERQLLAQMRRLAFDTDHTTMLDRETRAIEFAFAYVSADRAKRQKNIRRSKAKHRARLAASTSNSTAMQKK